MNLEDLVDIIEPTPVEWTPQTVGWVVLALAVALTSTLALRGWLRRRAANRYRREAEAELVALDGPTVASINAILKRTAMVAYSRDRIAALAGPAWVHFLRQAAGQALDPAPARLLADGGYSRRNVEGEELRAFACGWVRSHRTGLGPESGHA